MVTIFKKVLPFIKREKDEPQGKKMTIVSDGERESLRSDELRVPLAFKEKETLFRSHAPAQHEDFHPISLSGNESVGDLGKMSVDDIGIAQCFVLVRCRREFFYLSLMLIILGDIDEEVIFEHKIRICDLEPVDLRRSGIPLHGESPYEDG